MYLEQPYLKDKKESYPLLDYDENAEISNIYMNITLFFQKEKKSSISSVKNKTASCTLMFDNSYRYTYYVYYNKQNNKKYFYFCDFLIAIYDIDKDIIFIDNVCSPFHYLKNNPYIKYFSSLAIKKGALIMAHPLNMIKEENINIEYVKQNFIEHLLKIIRSSYIKKESLNIIHNCIQKFKKEIEVLYPWTKEQLFIDAFNSLKTKEINMGMSSVFKQTLKLYIKENKIPLKKSN